jgi:ureidoglycolate hydrolase
LDILKFLPLSEATYYVMLALDEPRHGYAVMQAVEAMSGGAVTIGPGTLYGAFNTLEKQKLIEKVSEEDRRSGGWKSWCAMDAPSHNSRKEQWHDAGDGGPLQGAFRLAG